MSKRACLWPKGRPGAQRGAEAMGGDELRQPLSPNRLGKAGHPESLPQGEDPRKSLGPGSVGWVKKEQPLTQVTLPWWEIGRQTLEPSAQTEPAFSPSESPSIKRP